jgi:glycosyltransferase involved in cell wall biosynthesis
VSRQPFVSIGLPVYNGQNFLRQAMEALLAQDYGNFELIISDNGSTDGTEAICREFAGRDRRVRCVRHSENRGSPWNFKFVVDEARGEYFLWAAHDDLWSESFLRKCVAMLEAHPSAVLCCTEINFIDGLGKRSIHYAGYKNIETLGKGPAGRIHELISRIGWFAIYGLMRTEATRRISLGMSEYGYDVVLLLELLLQGDFTKVKEPLFHFRILIEGKTAEAYQQDFQSAAPATTTPYAGLAARLMRTVYQSGLSSNEKARVFADFIVTLTCENSGWRENITGELLGAGARVNDSQFALLLGLVLNTSVPLDVVKQNAISEAIYRSPLRANDLLAEARRILGTGTGIVGVKKSGEDLFHWAAHLVECGRLEEASDAFDAALQKQETSDGWSDWATVQLACKKMSAAERGLRRALQLDGRNAAAAAKLGILMANMGRIPEAIYYLEQGMSGVSGGQQEAVAELLNGCRKKVAVALRTV